MKNFLLSINIVLLAFSMGACNKKNESDTPKMALNYPETRIVDQVDVINGVEIKDPYRWLESDIRESDAVEEWISAQNSLTNAYLGTIPERPLIKERLTEIWNYERSGTPFKEGEKYYVFRNDGLQNQSVLYSTDDLNGEWSKIIDPNTWSEDGTIAFSGYSFSKDGRYLAYGVQESGSDWSTWYFMDMENGEILPDILQRVKYTLPVWDGVGQGVYYGSYKETNQEQMFQSANANMKFSYHEIGTSEESDVLVYERPDDPELVFSPAVTEDGNYLILRLWKTLGENQLIYMDMNEKEAGFHKLFEGFEHSWRFIGNNNSRLYFLTNQNAPKNRIVFIDVEDDTYSIHEVVGEGPSVLQDVSHIGGRLILEYLNDVKSEVFVYEMDGSLVGSVDLPGIGSTSGFSGKSDEPETFYSFSSFNDPGSIFRLNVENLETQLFWRPKLAFNPDDYVVKQIFYKSKDETRVPAFIMHHKDAKIGSTPTILYGYGGFNASLLPIFSPAGLVWLDMGGIFVSANIRGGGEYGEAWHEAGTKTRKQNVFDDFISAAEYLIDEGYTSEEHLSIMGASNGGLLVGAVMNQRPELFKAAIPEVGVMDMLRFHLFTAGRFWTGDYGSIDNEDEFEALYAYSPYHNLKDGVDYPATLVTTADTDDRVVPGHSFKYIARLQAVHSGADPVLIRIEERAGHGGGMPTSKRIDKYTDIYGFLLKNLEMNLPESFGK